MDKEIEELLKDSLKQANKGIKIRDRIIVFLIAILALLSVAMCFTGVALYDSMSYEYVTTTTETTETTTYTDSEVDQSKDTKDVGMSAEGDNANVEYNEIAGNQYNDSAVHNEGGGSE